MWNVAASGSVVDMSKHTTLAAIEARQKREVAMQQFTAVQAVEARQRLMADWELKGNAKASTKDLYRLLDRAQASHNDTVVARRQRLAELLTQEQAEHERLLNNLTETDAQRRERLIRKAQELRAQRESSRQEQAERRQDRQLREQIDTLRQAESRLKVMQVADARYDQLKAAAQRREQEKSEDLFFVQQAVEAQRLANERAQADLEARYVRERRLQEDLSAQVQGNAMRKANEEAEKAKETAEFYRLLHEEQTAATQQRLARLEAQRALAKEMMDLNEELERARRQEYERLRDEEKQALDALLAQLATEAQEQREAKQAKLEAEREAMLELQQQLAVKKENDHALDALWQEASDKEWEKKEARWRADQAKRDALLHSILLVRRQQVAEKRQAQRDAAAEKQAEHDAFLATLAADRDGDAEAQAQRLAELKSLQRYLDWQISERNAQKAEELRLKRIALTDQAALEKEHEDRIAKELAALEAAKPERYRNVPLLAPGQRNRPF